MEREKANKQTTKTPLSKKPTQNHPAVVESVDVT